MNSNNAPLLITADSEFEGFRLDTALRTLSGLSRSRLQALIESGEATLNGGAAKKSALLKEGDEISLYVPDAVDSPVLPEDIPLSILYEDDCLLVVNKPKGMVVHPAPGNPSGTLVNALLYACRGRLSSIGGVIRPGIVHRIDKDTSGALMVAKTDEAHESLAAQIAEHSFLREYRAIVYGGFKEPDGVVLAPIGRSKSDRKKQAVGGINPREAKTSYRVLDEFLGFSELSLALTTGRTHQIRVHMAHIGHPVAGDAVYGPKKCITALNGQCLHAERLGFRHPKSGEWLEFLAPLPEYFKEFKATLTERSY